MIYIVLPVYNEEKNIARVFAGIRSVLKNCSHTIIAVNDGSRDKSLSIIHANKKTDVVLTTGVNMNVGAVFSAGIAKTLELAKDSDTLVIMESDGTSDLSILKDLTDGIIKKKQDVMIASRYQKGGEYRRFPFLRRVFSWGANRAMKRYFPIAHVYDYTIFYRSYRIGIIRKAVKAYGIFGLIQSRGFVANAELLVKLSLFTDRISEIPFIYDYGQKKGSSKIGVLRTIAEYILVVTYLSEIVKKTKRFTERK
jgi:glycosyltransferase involved in cell wall biosynthesis